MNGCCSKGSYSLVTSVLPSRFPRFPAGKCSTGLRVQPRVPAAGAELPAPRHSCPPCSRHCHTSPQSPVGHGSAWRVQGSVSGSAAPGEPANVHLSIHPSVRPSVPARSQPLRASEHLAAPGTAALQPQPCCVGEHGQCCSHFPAATSRRLLLRSAGLM